MSPEVEAAVIAGCFGVLTLIGTLAAQFVFRQATSRDTKETLERTFVEQRGQLDRTLAEQREQLDTTLAAQSKQLERTLADQRTRTLNERFATAAGQLGGDKPPAVRLAGVYAMAGLADDWEENRQTCVDVLCGYLRMPYEPDPGNQAPEAQRLAFRASREVRHTVIRIITGHLKDTGRNSWRGLNLDFTGVVFDGGSFQDARFRGGIISFHSAKFCSGTVDFSGAKFSGGTVDFSGAKFSGGTVDFSATKFSGDCFADFADAQFSSGTVEFTFARFSRASTVDFANAQFSGGTVSFHSAWFARGNVYFSGARFSGGTVGFTGVTVFPRGTVDFGTAHLSGSTVDFGYATFSGGLVDFSQVSDWSCPPRFPWAGEPPPGVKLPEKVAQSQP